MDQALTHKRSQECSSGTTGAVFFLFGIPRVITTDQGREFKNTLNTELTTALGIQHRLTTAYHPQANGLDERWNQTFKNTIVKFIDGKSEEWDKFLPEICYSYNTAVQEVRNAQHNWLCNGVLFSCLLPILIS